MKTYNGSSRLFLIISLIILTSDGLFVWINFQASRQAMLTGLEDEMSEARAAFQLALDNTESMLLQTASFVAGDKRVQQLFLQGKRAVEAEGGGPGKEGAAAARQALFDLLGPGWDKMQENYQVRQLHFHLGPGSNSFLRVHKPKKFGDNMDTVRYTIVDANQKRITTRGFETGRVYSGIRGVTPVYAEDPDTGEQIHVGALEAGTSFPLMFEALRRHTGTHFAVLLHHDHMAANVWPDYLQRLYDDNPAIGHYYLESASDEPGLRRLTASPAFLREFGSNNTRLLQTDRPWMISTITLRDYKGHSNPDHPDAGRLVLWRNADTAVNQFWNGFYTNVAFAVAAFLFLEAVLYFGIHAVTRRLERLVDKRTRELAASNNALETRNTELADSLEQLRTTQSDLVESEKMASLGRLVAGVAHEVNTPVGSGMTAATHLLDKVQEFGNRLQQGSLQRSELDRFLDVTQRSARIVQNNLQRAAELVRSFKQVAVDRSSEELRQFELCEYLTQVMLSLQPHLKKTPHQIHMSCGEDLRVTTYPGALAQILSNLVLNSLYHAFEPNTRGNIYIDIHFNDDGRLRLEFRDDGRGIPEAIRSKVFEPFFTTRRDAGGSGLGLNIVYNLVTKTLGGTIEIADSGSSGTTLLIEFPVSHETGGSLAA